MPEKIDSFTLDIGLTSEEFQAGINKVIDSMGRMQSQAAETGEGMAASFASLGDSVASLALRFASMFFAFKGIEGLVDYFKHLHKELSDLGKAAEYLGVSAAGMQRFGEVAILAGGQARDAIAGVSGLESAIFGLEFQGQISQNLMMLQRLGVAYLTAGGQMRNFKDIVFDTAAALQRQLPGDANQAMRVQWAAQIFGPGGLANAIGGPIGELRSFYAKSTAANKDITDKLIAQQVKLSRDLTDLSYRVKGDAAAILDKLTPAIEQLIHAIETGLIPTIDELISDVMDWMHPGRMIDKVDKALGLGPNNALTHPLNYLQWDLALGLNAAHGLHEWWEKQTQVFRLGKLEAFRVPAPVEARLAPDTNINALKLLHMEAGGEEGDPTWSKAVTAYRTLGSIPGGPAAYVSSALVSGNLVPSVPHAHALSTPSAARPHIAAPGGAAASRPTSSTVGPRVQIGSMTINTQATDAMGIMADASRAVARKFLVSQADPGLA